MKRYPSLRAYLKGERTNQEALAALLEVRQGTVSKWVRGETMPRSKMARKINKLTGVTIEGLWRARADRDAA